MTDTSNTAIITFAQRRNKDCESVFFFLVGRRLFSRVRRFEKTEPKNWSVQLWNYSAFYLAFDRNLICLFDGMESGQSIVRIRTRSNCDKHAQKRTKCCACLRRGANLEPLDYKALPRQLGSLNGYKSSRNKDCESVFFFGRSTVFKSATFREDRIEELIRSTLK